MTYTCRHCDETFTSLSDKKSGYINECPTCVWLRTRPKENVIERYRKISPTARKAVDAFRRELIKHTGIHDESKIDEMLERLLT